MSATDNAPNDRRFAKVQNKDRFPCDDVQKGEQDPENNLPGQIKSLKIGEPYINAELNTIQGFTDALNKLKP